jgi:hypothetical protein
MLMARDAPLEQLNTFGGTVLSSTIWFALHVTDEEFVRRNYPLVIDKLFAAGARTDLYPELQAELDDVQIRASRFATQQIPSTCRDGLNGWPAPWQNQGGVR